MKSRFDFEKSKENMLVLDGVNIDSVISDDFTTILLRSRHSFNLLLNNK